MWACLCECGNRKTVEGYSLTSGHTISCGCWQKEKTSAINKTHGQYGSRLYRVWNAMRQRCGNANNQNYHLYGAEGKTVCQEWQTFESFYEWAVKGYRAGLTIERIDNRKGYSPDNCKWVTPQEQSNNTRRNRFIAYNGQTKTMAQWAKEYHINYNTLNSRINTLKWDIEKALNTP